MAACISIICTIVIRLEPIRFFFTATTFLAIGIYNTMEYRAEGNKSSLIFSIMFYCFSLSALVFACISIVLDRC